MFGAKRFREVRPEDCSGLFPRSWRVVGYWTEWLESVGDGGTEPESEPYAGGDSRPVERGEWRSSVECGGSTVMLIEGTEEVMVPTQCGRRVNGNPKLIQGLNTSPPSEAVLNRT